MHIEVKNTGVKEASLYFNPNFGLGRFRIHPLHVGLVTTDARWLWT